MKVQMALSNLKREVIVHRNAIDGSFVAEAPKSEGSAADASTYAKAVSSVKIIMC